MPQAIVLQDDSLARGIEQAGSALGNALMHRAVEKRQQEKRKKTATILEYVMSQIPENPTAIDIQTAMARASQAEDVDQDYINDTFKTFIPLYKEKMKGSEAMQYLKKIREMNGEGASQGYQETGYPEEGGAPMGPMQQPQSMPPLGIVDPQYLQQQQPMFQQQFPQQQPIPKPSSQQPSPSLAYTIPVPLLGNVNRAQIDALLGAPYDNLVHLGDSLDRRWNDQYKANSKEAQEVRREDRANISKYAEPYQEINKLRTNVSKLKEAEKLIDSGKVSFTDNWLRNAVTAILDTNAGTANIAEFVKTPEQQRLFYLLKDALKTREIGGSNPSTKEVLLSLSALPNQYKSQSANKYIIRNMVHQAESDLYKAEQISKLRQKAGPISFAKFQADIENDVGKFMESKQEELGKVMQMVEVRGSIKGKPLPSGFVWMMDPDGVARQVPKSHVKEFQQNGGSLIR